MVFNYILLSYLIIHIRVRTTLRQTHSKTAMQHEERGRQEENKVAPMPRRTNCVQCGRGGGGDGSRGQFPESFTRRTCGDSQPVRNEILEFAAIPANRIKNYAHTSQQCEPFPAVLGAATITVLTFCTYTEREPGRREAERKSDDIVDRRENARRNL